MKVTFPHMSPVIVYKKLFELLGHEVIMPPTPTQKTIDLGVKNSPEFACFPLKVIMGSYIEAIEKGAEVIVTSGGDGPCRAGYYGELHQRILKSLGYNVEIIVFDALFPRFGDFMKGVFKIKGRNSVAKVIKTLKTVYRLAYAVDGLEKRIEKLRAYEVTNGDCNRAWDEILDLFDKVSSIDDVKDVEEKAGKILDRIPHIKVQEQNKIRVGIVGEIYVVLESSINMEIEKILGSLGVETERSQYLSEWIEFNMIPKAFRDKKIDNVMEKGKKFIEIQIGGHAQETVGFIKDFKDRGFDGIIHLMPFGCLPELVTQSIVPEMTKKFDMPVLTIPIDEQTGKANNLTRIEAFIDLLRSKKNMTTIKSDKVAITA
ncbi:MAG: acyl-CoA dehydratase activase-related protein [Clostridia bacterium]|nr:acyl-CoA dehydratase activase-related protein [Clostridia bacterium]